MNDPLFMSGNFYPDKIRQLESDRQRLVQQYEELRQFVPSQQSSPIWDEIDNIIASLSDSELDYLNKNDEYIKSSSEINAILNREYLNIMRPIVERTSDGKNALTKHLELVKNLRKSAKDAMDKRYSMIDDYMANHSDISFKQYLDMFKAKDE